MTIKKKRKRKGKRIKKERKRTPTVFFFFFLFLSCQDYAASPFSLVSFFLLLLSLLVFFFFCEGSKSHARYERSNKDPPRKLGSLLRAACPSTCFACKKHKQLVFVLPHRANYHQRPKSLSVNRHIGKQQLCRIILLSRTRLSRLSKSPVLAIASKHH